MKKFSILLLCFVLFFSACGSEPEKDTNSPAKSESKYTFKVVSADNFEIKIDQDMAEVLAGIGDPLAYFEAASCAFDGLDKTYTYAGFVITTRPDGDKDYVNAILLTDDSVTTPEGLYIGSSAEAVIESYGEAERTDTRISYVDGNTTLSFILKDGYVISIEYIPVS